MLFGGGRKQTLDPENVQKWYLLHYSTYRIDVHAVTKCLAEGGATTIVYICCWEQAWGERTVHMTHGLLRKWPNRSGEGKATSYRRATVSEAWKVDGFVNNRKQLVGA